MNFRRRRWVRRQPRQPQRLFAEHAPPDSRPPGGQPAGRSVQQDLAGVTKVSPTRPAVPGTGRLHLLEAARAVRSACEQDTGADVVPPVRSMAVVGSGLAEVTAREAALKLREASRQIAVGYDAELFLHGSAVPYDDALVLIGDDGPERDGFLDAVARAAGSAGVATHRLEAPSLGGHPVLDQFAVTARLQLLAAHLAERRGCDPDTVITGGWCADDLWSIGRPVDPVSRPEGLRSCWWSEHGG